MTTQISTMPLVYEERLSETFAVPALRHIAAELEILSSAPASASAPNTLSLAVELKQPGGEFVEIGATAPTDAPGRYTVEIPLVPEQPVLAPLPVFRLRLRHEGRHEMRWRARVQGL